MEKGLTLVPLQEDLFKSVVELANKLFGPGYMSLGQLEKFFKDTGGEKANLSFVFKNTSNEVIGFRLTYGPNTWQKPLAGKIKYDSSRWGCPENKAGYFWTIGLDSRYQGAGLAKEMSEASANALKAAGAQAILTFSWKQSPGGASQRYLEKFGFKAVHEWPNFWSHLDYECVLCGKNCHCSAIEMIKKL